ncbi:HEAT repeat-containing protein 6, partial [Borealophlyctis nickersoniae]
MDRSMSFKRSIMMGSDSEFSDGEAGLPRQRLRDGRLQQNALLCLQALAKAVPKQLYPYWDKFLPDIPSMQPAPSLISVMRHHELPNVRLAACASLTAFLDGSKQYLAVADDSAGSKGSFTSLSQKVAEQLREVHQGLIQAVALETQPVLLAQEIRCLSILVKNCSYERLSRDYRPEVKEAIVGRLQQDDFAIKSAVIDCISSLLDAGMSYPSSPNHQIIDSLLPLTDRSEHLSVRVASYEGLCSVARNKPEAIRERWKEVDAVLTEGMKDGKDAVRAASMKMLEQYAHSCSTAEGEEKKAPASWWSEMLDKYVQLAVADTFYAVRSLGCDCLSHVPPDIFRDLPPKRRFSCLTIALGMAQEDDPNVRAAACRTLGVYVSYPSIMEDQDMFFLIDVATTVPQYASDRNLNVRIRASWTLANLCDAFVIMSKQATDGAPTLEDAGVTESIIVELIKAGLVAARDNDKCRSNGVRALGNIIRSCSTQFLRREAERLVKEVVLAVLKNVDSGTVK